MFVRCCLSQCAGIDTELKEQLAAESQFGDDGRRSSMSGRSMGVIS